MPTTYVYVYLEEGPVPAGLLETIGVGREATSRFRYGRHIFREKNDLRLTQSSCHCPTQILTVTIWHQRVSSCSTEFGMPRPTAGGGTDGPRGRRAGSLGIRLSGRNRRCSRWRAGLWSGSLRSAARSALAKRNWMVKILTLRACCTPYENWTRRTIFRGNIDAFFRVAPHSAERAPKATTEFDGRQWIAKFGRADDRFPICRAEYVTMTLAKQVGINIPNVRIEKVLGQDIYLIERFDRIPDGKEYKRLPFISGLTIIGAHESESPLQSYRRLAEQLRLFGSNPSRTRRNYGGGWCSTFFATIMMIILGIMDSCGMAKGGAYHPVTTSSRFHK